MPAASTRTYPSAWLAVIKYIRVLNGTASGREFLLDKLEVVCGRDAKNDLVIADANISRRHCRFVAVKDGSHFLIEDLNSSNGTFVNNTAVRSKVLVFGDRVQIGSTLLEFSAKNETSDDLHVAEADVDESGEPTLITNQKFGSPKFQTNSPLKRYDLIEGKQSFIQNAADLDLFYQVSEISSGHPCLDSLCTHVTQVVSVWAGTEQSLLMLFDDDERELVEIYSSYVPKEESSTAGTVKPSKINYDLKLVDRVVNCRLPSLSSFQVAADTSAEDASKKSTEFEAMCVPINIGEKLLGLIYVDSLHGVEDRAKTVFDPNGLQTLAAIGIQLSAAIANLSLIQAAQLPSVKNTTDQLVLSVSHRINNLLQMNSGGEFLVDLALESNDIKRVAESWITVRRSQNRIRQLSVNLSTFCHDFEKLLRELSLHDLIKLAASGVSNSFDRKRLKIFHRTNADFKIKLDEHYSSQAIENILTVGMMASETGRDGKDEVILETSLSGKEVLIRIGFRHFDDRFNLVQLLGTVDKIDKIKAGMGMLEMLISRKIVEGQSGTIKCFSEGENFNWIEVRFSHEGNRT